MEHSLIDPAILYFGTPVALLSTVADDGITNTAPMSSIFWLGQTAILGMGGRSQTAQNLLANGECVITLRPQGDHPADPGAVRSHAERRDKPRRNVA